jgi:hypothetical protein
MNTFEEYAREVKIAFDKWVDALTHRDIEKATDLKETASDLITGWKSAFPNKKEAIDAAVDAHYARRFQ